MGILGEGSRPVATHELDLTWLEERTATSSFNHQNLAETGRLKTPFLVVQETSSVTKRNVDLNRRFSKRVMRVLLLFGQ